MKRFYCAVLLLFIILTSSVYLNIKINEKSDELIKIISFAAPDTISNYWSKYELLFEITLPETYTESIQVNIEKLKDNTIPDQQIRNELIIDFKKIKESIALNLENIF
jgi:hypothetical protein